MSKDIIKDVVREMKEQIEQSIDFSHDADAASWGYEEGILISRNQAIAVVDLIEKQKLMAEEESEDGHH